MARTYTAASSHHLETSSAPISAPPFSMACWYNTTGTTTIRCLMWMGTQTVDNDYWRMILHSSGVVRIVAEVAAGATATSTSTSYSSGVWEHACAVVAAANDRRIFLNGGGKGTSSVSRAVAAPTRLGVGWRAGSVPAEYMDGSIAEVGIWNLALADEDVTRLASGLSPNMVRPEGLVGYWRMIGRYSPEIDRRNSLGLTVTGAVAGDHVRQFHRARLYGRGFTTAAAASAKSRVFALMGVG